MFQKFGWNTILTKDNKKGLTSLFLFSFYNITFKFIFMDWLNVFKFEIIDNKYKIYYLGDEPISVFISTKLIGFDNVFKTVRYTFQGKYCWFIPNLDYRGCSTISFRNLNTQEYMFDKLVDLNLSRTAKGQNIICLGLNKTGTTSFTKAMEQLGYTKFGEEHLFHYIQSDVYFGDYGKMNSILNNPQINLFQDMPFSFPNVYKKIYELRPQDLYVLTLRKDAQSWAKTCVKFWECLQSENFRDDRSFIHTFWSDESQRQLINFLEPMFESWGLKSLENLEEKLVKIYEKHKEDCELFFKDKNNFISVDIEKKGELKKLTNWLGFHSIQEDFPWENRRSS